MREPRQDHFLIPTECRSLTPPWPRLSTVKLACGGRWSLESRVDGTYKPSLVGCWACKRTKAYKNAVAAIEIAFDGDWRAWQLAELRKLPCPFADEDVGMQSRKV